jgi:DNA-binding GntR family transcriptional regulator
MNTLKVDPIDTNFSLKERIHVSLKQAICNMNIYEEGVNLRLDERKLSEQLATSRTPIREALARLEQEGLVRIVPRKGVYIVRKSKDEILEMITVWAALESMAARLVTQRATDPEIASLREIFSTFEDGQVGAHIDEYSEANISFHQSIVEMSQCVLLKEMTSNIFMHIRSIRARTIGESDRAERSIIDHMHIIEALEARDADLAERLARDHALGLANHVALNVSYLEQESSR